MDRLRIPLIAALLAAADAAAAQDFTPFLEVAIANARLECEQRGGAFDFDMDKIVHETPDLNGDGRPDFVFDRSGFRCDGDNAIYGDRGSWWLTVLISGEGGGGLHRLEAQGWRVVEWSGEGGGAAMLILKYPGGACGGSDADPCFQALTWSGMKTLSALGYR